MKLSMIRLLTTCFVTLALASCASSVMAQGDPPPIHYRISWIDGLAATPRDMNDSGTIVSGDSMVYDGILVGLNDLGATWYDLDDPSGAPATGWVVDRTEDINEIGQIVGRAVNENTALPSRVFKLDFPNDWPTTPPVITLLPHSGNQSDDNEGMAINELGVVIGSLAGGEIVVFTPWSQYSPLPLLVPGSSIARINNLGTVVTWMGAGNVIHPTSFDLSAGTYEYTPGIYEHEPDRGLRAINEQGFACGSQNEISTGKGKRKTVLREGGVIRLDTTNGVEEILAPGDFPNFGHDINEQNQVLFFLYQTTPPNYLYTDEHGVLALDDLIVNRDELRQDVLSGTSHMTNANETGFPVICGRFEENIYILTPELPYSPPGISVTPTTGLVTTESGGQDAFDVVLDSEPTANVIVGLSSSNTVEGAIDKSSLTFTDSNWDTPQTVTVTGVDDAIEDGDVAYAIVTAAATSTDSDYDGHDANDVSVTNEDDDSPPGGGTEMYSSGDTPTNIPDRGMADSTIIVNDNYQIVDMTVTLAISHPRPSDLDVYLVGPNSDVVQLFNFSGGNAVSDFNGISTNGPWTLEVYDTRKKKTGELSGWFMTVDY